ncbi:hypothetical protein BD310DRAFT_510981 [Dichomitus squalens]|uniref:Uncharacterized protein n=1 Tax=Dichomitus squalens TaxID=114155 RepID=A0A4Q9PTW2_9APHY|nr:hypothetical protein BD310DRAFT_510981 [Dichomitus squalens]
MCTTNTISAGHLVRKCLHTPFFLAMLATTHAGNAAVPSRTIADRDSDVAPLFFGVAVGLPTWWLPTGGTIGSRPVLLRIFLACQEGRFDTHADARRTWRVLRARGVVDDGHLAHEEMDGRRLVRFSTLRVDQRVLVQDVAGS